MRKLVAMGYIKKGLFFILTSFFSVPKGTEDIGMVFDATLSGLNHSIWGPNFMFPSMGSLIFMVGPKLHMFNLDVGEMFYNFQLFLVLANYCEVDLGSYLWHKKDQQGTPLWMRWLRLMMGLMLSP